jgi:peptidoglycan/xylan/chitin deacetylase (PgdA/CDA1 family)
MIDAKRLFFSLLRVSGANAVLRYVNRGKLKCLLFHGVASAGEPMRKDSIRADTFVAQLEHLQRRYNVVSMDARGEIVGMSPSKVNILLTFDDGWSDNYTTAMPILEKFGFRAVFFLISDAMRFAESPPLGQSTVSLGLSTKALQPGEYLRSMNISQVRDAVAKGHTVGSHSKSHNDYAKLSLEQVVTDAVSSAQAITADVQSPVTSFAFPWGRYADDQLQALRPHFRRVFTTERGFCSPSDFMMRRSEATTTLQLEAIASGSLDIVLRVRRLWKRSS